MVRSMAVSTTVVVPINVQAVRVLEQDKDKFKGPTVLFGQIGTDQAPTHLGVEIAQDLSRAQASSPIDEGIHLHWALPDALTHGLHDPSTDTIAFPTVPNRWLVTRIFRDEGAASSAPGGGSAAVKVRQWILESNRFLAKPSGSGDAGGGTMTTAIPALGDDAAPAPTAGPQQLPTTLPPPPTLSHQYLGTRQLYGAEWVDAASTQPGNYDPQLNAVSYYGPDFAAYYQNGPTVFGFSDDFADLGYGQGHLFTASFSVSYQVIGWYGGSASDDILRPVLARAREAYVREGSTSSKADCFEACIRRELKWQLPPRAAGGDAGEDWPADVQSLYAGVALDIQWQPQGKREFLPSPDAVRDALNVEIAVGNNSAEALSALISAEHLFSAEPEGDDAEPYPVVERNVELLMNAFQQDLLRRLAGADPGAVVSRLEEHLHSLRFSARSGGATWSVRPARGAAERAEGAKGAAQVQLTAPAAELLSQLNAAQQTYDRQTATLESCQRQAYLDWTRWALMQSADVLSADNAAARQFIESALLRILTESGRRGVLAKAKGPSSLQSLNLRFEPVWTAVNEAAAGQIALLATAENVLRIALPAIVARVGSALRGALAILEGGNAAAALKEVQALGADTLLQARLAELRGLITPTAAVDDLRTALARNITSLSTELAALSAAAQGSAAEPGLEQLIRAFETQGAFAAALQLTRFIAQQRPTLFDPTNLIDTQQIFLCLEAANFDATTVVVCGAKLLHAQHLVQKARDDIADEVLPRFKTALASASGLFPQLLEQVNATENRLGDVVAKLGGAGATAEGKAALIALLQSLQQFADQLKASQQTSATIRLAWQSLLLYLPTAHQVVILARILGEAVQRVDPLQSLQQVPAPAYWLPNEPVVVIAQPGDSQQSLRPVNRCGAATLLPCRRATDLLTALGLNAGGTVRTLIAATMLGKTALPNVHENLGERQPVVQQLLAEAFWLAPQAADDLLRAAGGFTDATVASLRDIQHQVAARMTSDQAGQLDPPWFTEVTVASSTGAPPALPSAPSPPLSATFHGVLPYYTSVNLLGDSNPFLPLYLAWTAEFETLQLADGEGHQGSVFTPDFLTRNFSFDTDQVELLYTQPPPSLQQSGGQAQPVFLSGQVTLSTTSAANLLHQVRLYLKGAIGVDVAQGPMAPAGLKNDFQRDLYAVYEDLRTRVTLSQGLNGFNAGLLQQLPLLQLPLNEIEATDATTTSLFMHLQKTWNNAQWNQASVAAGTALNLFAPWRAGLLRMQTLAVVDAFGRFFQLGTQGEAAVQRQVVVAGAFEQTPGNPLGTALTGSANDIYLPPRLVQPARLSFDWLSAQAEAQSGLSYVASLMQTADSPITGWMLPDHLTDGLLIYDADGTPLGALALEGSKRVLTWRPPPSDVVAEPGHNGRDQMVGVDLAGAHPVLRDFLTRFLFPQSAGDSPFQDFLDAVDRSQRFIHTNHLQQDKGLAVLVGKPLVLVRAVLRLDLLGRPVVAADAASFEEATHRFATAKPQDRTTWHDYEGSTRFQAGMMDVALPVMLGDLNQFDDGLVGFFLGDDFSTFHTPAAAGSHAGVKKSSWKTVQLVPNDNDRVAYLKPGPAATPPGAPASKEWTLTLVMDPRAAVHASTGILPVKALRIPPAQYQGAMNRLMAYFMANPVLVGPQQVQIPVPVEAGRHWSWVEPAQPATTLATNVVGDRARFGYSPQRIVDGWLELKTGDSP